MSNRPDRPRHEADLIAFERGRSAGLRSIPPQLRPSEPPQEAIALDPLAHAEERRFEQGDYEQQARRGRHRRGEAAKGAFHVLKLSALWFGAAVFVALNIAWFCHVGLPERWRWLPANDVTLIQYIIGTIWVGKMGMLLERYASKHSDDD